MKSAVKGKAHFCREMGGSTELCQGREAASFLEGLQGRVVLSIVR